MTVMKKTEQKDDAVSPVVGVMLMLVVTIIIAAVVAAFAGGVMTSQEPAPTAILDVTFDSAYYFEPGGGMTPCTYPLFKVSYLSGTSNLDTGKMSISSSWKGNDGKLYSYVYSGNKTFSCYGNPLGVMYKATTSDVTSDSSFWFDNCELSPGEILVSAGQYVLYGKYQDDVLEINDDSSLKSIFGDNYTTIQKGTELTLTISYGNYVIYDGKVIVE